MLFGTRFDLVISIGEFCACSGYLRRFKLQDYSYPFDWLLGGTFSSRIELLANNFDSFLDQDNLHKFEKRNNGPDDPECDFYHDDKHNFDFLHDFKVNKDFKEEYKKVKAKYDRRIQRMYNQIEQSDKVLFVWYGLSNFPDTKTVLDGYKKLVEKFPRQSVYLLIIEHCEDKKEEIYLENNRILITKYYNLIANTTMGSETNNSKLFSQIKMKHEPKWYFKFLIYSLIKIPVEIIPFKKLRTSLRKELKLRFYKDKL